MNRMSILDVSQYCGQAAPRNEGAVGRAAIMSATFHALCANQPDAKTLLARLTPEEQEEIMKWHKPEPFEVGGVTVHYEACEQEVELGLTTQGEYCTKDDPNLLTLGHMDFGAIVPIKTKTVAIQVDMKKSKYTVDGPDTLQNHGYGMSYASKHKADAYMTGLWILEDGEYIWGSVVDVDSFEALEILSRINHAATNEGEAVRGGHCRKCYGRMKCPDHLFPVICKDTWLYAMAEGGEATKENMAQLCLDLESLKDVIKECDETRKAFALQNSGQIRCGARVWSLSKRQGNETVDKKLLRQKLGKDAEQYISRGKPYYTPQWKQYTERGK